MSRPSRPWEERFWERVDRSGGPDECWPWLGPNGRTLADEAGGTGQDRTYGRFYIDPTRYQVPSHRLALELHLGRPLREGVHVLHSCDYPRCCNPAHLREGSAADNGADRAARPKPKGTGFLRAPRVALDPKPAGLDPDFNYEAAARRLTAWRRQREGWDPEG